MIKVEGVLFVSLFIQEEMAMVDHQRINQRPVQILWRNLIGEFKRSFEDGTFYGAATFAATSTA